MNSQDVLITKLLGTIERINEHCIELWAQDEKYRAAIAPIRDWCDSVLDY